MKQRQRQQIPSDAAQVWLLLRRLVPLEGIELLPQENMYLKGTPLIVARGQAQAFYLDDATGRVWILKKFLPGRNPDARYIQAIQSLVPRHAGFESGYQRRVLSQASVPTSALPSADFAQWIEHTILMPLVKGSDWAYVADRVREGTLTLSPEQRLLMCRKLSQKVKLLEAGGLSHRDLSSTNIFVETRTGDTHLIDWDSLYHPNLSIPPNTTFGTNGYIAPFVRVNGMEDAHVTWSPSADRFSMAALNVEFLTVEQHSPLTGDGGMLDQDELYQRGGRGIDKIARGLRQNFPGALGLFERVLRAASFDQCPSPDEWIALGAGVSAPSLRDVYDPQPDFQKFIHAIQKPPTPPPPAPSLDDLTRLDLSAPFIAAAQAQAPPAPSLSSVKTQDVDALRALLAAAPKAPGLEELQDPVAGLRPPAVSETPAPAPSLSDIEDPIAGTNGKGGDGTA